MTTFGLSKKGFKAARLQDVVAQLQAAHRSKFGRNVSLGASTVFGQLIGIYAERTAELWEGLAALYASQFPGGAEGVAVDNLLAGAGLTRLPETKTRTDPSPTLQNNGVALYGLVLYGAPGTVIPAAALVRSDTAPVRSFTLDAAVTIGAAANGLQNLVFSAAPDSGTYGLTLTTPGGTELSTDDLPYDTHSTISRLKFAAPPTSGTYRLMFDGQLVEALAYDADWNTVTVAVHAVPGLSFVFVSGSPEAGWAFNPGFSSPSYSPRVRVDNTLVRYAANPTVGSFTLNVNGIDTEPLAYTVNSDQVQAALRALGEDYAATYVAIDDDAPAYGIAINWPTPAPPVVTVSSNTMDVAVTLGSTQQLDVAAAVSDSLQTAVNHLVDPDGPAYFPFSDTFFSQSGNTVSVFFGSVPNGPTAAKAIPLITARSSALFKGTDAVNVAVALAASGSPAQGVGSATCTEAGPFEVAAGQLNGIGSSQVGWSGVTNQLDCITGSDEESDEEALARQRRLNASRGNGPLPSIVGKVAQLSGVGSAVGFANLSAAAQQIVRFSAEPSGGTYRLALQGYVTAPIDGDATAGEVQAAINSLPGYNGVSVLGSTRFGFYIDLGDSTFGGQAQPLIDAVQNTTGSDIRVTFGRSPKSYELVVEGGSESAIAEAIYASAPAGIASYGTPAAVTDAAVTNASAAIIVASNAGIAVGQMAEGQGIAAGSRVAAVTGTQVTLTQPAIGTYAAAEITFGYGATVNDAAGNASLIRFSRPTPVLIYVALSLVTDRYRTPGVAASGLNPASKFSPGSILQIQRDIVELGNQVPVGGLVVTHGTDGLYGGFNEVEGIVDYTLYIGIEPGPTSDANIQMLPIQDPSFQVFNTAVAYI